MPVSDKLTSPRAEALRSAPLNSWVVLSEDESRVIATGTTYDEVVKKCDEAGIADPILIKTPREWVPYSL
jgi:hypothetical protein